MDFKTFVAPLHPFVMRNPARGGNGNQHPFGDAIKVAKRLTESPGALMSVDLPDMLPGWPYNWPGMDNWLNQVKAFIEDKKKSGLTNWYGLEIWNEPDGTWKESNGSFNEMWKKTYDLIRQADPGEKIIGPCYSYYQENKLKDFLQYCKQNDCIPDIISWHELSGIDGVASHLKAYRNLERSLGIKELPISINEYCDAEHELEGQPGSSARFIGKFERYKVDSAMITWWFVPHPGRLGSLMATDTEKGAGWYFYQWYGDMTGDMVSVTPPNENSKNVDGAACVDASKGYVSFIFGGPNDGSINAVIKNLPTFIGSAANVKVEKVDWKSKDTPSSGPDKIFEKSYPVTNGQISVDLSGTNGSSGYRIYITGTGGAGGAGAGAGDAPAPAPVPAPGNNDNIANNNNAPNNNNNANNGFPGNDNNNGNNINNQWNNNNNNNNNQWNNNNNNNNNNQWNNNNNNNNNQWNNNNNNNNNNDQWNNNNNNNNNNPWNNNNNNNPWNNNQWNNNNNNNNQWNNNNNNNPWNNNNNNPWNNNNNNNNNQWNNNGNVQQATTNVSQGPKYKIVNRNSNKVLTAGNDGNVQQWSDNGNTNQQWTMTKEGNGYKIVNVGTNMALDVSGASKNDGSNVVVSSSNTGTNQLWSVQEIGAGYSVIQNLNSAKNLDVEKGSIIDGGNVLQWSNNGNSNQQWKIVTV
ncbi:hypothetical protein U3516DRAFT_548831 [Neocallimastix sp. 'constans']